LKTKIIYEDLIVTLVKKEVHDNRLQQNFTSVQYEFSTFYYMKYPGNKKFKNDRARTEQYNNCYYQQRLLN